MILAESKLCSECDKRVVCKFKEEREILKDKIAELSSNISDKVPFGVSTTCHEFRGNKTEK